MTPYSAIAARPLPCPVPLSAVISATYSPQALASKAKPRKVSFAADESEDFSAYPRISDKEMARKRTHKPETFEKYAKLLSTTEWTPTRDFCRAMHINANSVNRYLESRSDLVEKMKVMRQGVLVNLWRLKANAELNGSRGASDLSAELGEEV